MRPIGERASEGDRRGLLPADAVRGERMDGILVYLRLFAEEHEMVVHFLAAARRIAIVAEGLAGGGGIEVGAVSRDVRARVEQERCVRNAVLGNVILVVRAIPRVVPRADVP